MGEGAADDDAHPLEQGGGELHLGEFHLKPCLTQATDEVEVVCLAEVFLYALRDDGAHAFGFEELLGGGGLKGIDVLELTRKEFGHDLTHEADAERKEHTVERHLTALRNAVKEATGRLLTRAVHAQELVDGEGVKVGSIAKDATLKEGCHRLGAKAIDVHGFARDEVLNATLELGRTLGVVGAIMRRFAFVAHEGCATLGTGGAEHDLRSWHKRACLGVDAHDLRNDFARLLYVHIVAQVEVELVDDVGIVKRCALDDGARKLHGIHIRHGSYGTRTTHLEGHLVEHRATTLGLKLISDCPTRTFGGEAEALALVVGVDFEHNAVRSHGEVLAHRVPIVNELEHLVKRVSKASGF